MEIYLLRLAHCQPMINWLSVVSTNSNHTFSMLSLRHMDVIFCKYDQRFNPFSLSQLLLPPLSQFLFQHLPDQAFGEGIQELNLFGELEFVQF